VSTSWEATTLRLCRTIRHRRLDLGLSQPDLARLAGLSLRRVQQIEAGQAANPSLKAIYLISKALQLDMADIFALPLEKSSRQRAPKKNQSTER
jgi:transcriptional regulator with XRE-family HTH domain